MRKIRLLLIDDHVLFRQGVARLLNAEPDIELRLHCGTVGEGLVAVGANLVDLVLLDENLGPERGIDFLVQARANGYRGPVLVLTAGISSAEEELLRWQGISGVLNKHEPVDLLVRRIREVSGTGFIVPQPAVSPNELAPPRLSSRESEVMRLVVEGYTNKEIAAQLGVSEATVKATMQHLFHKTGTHTRSQLVRAALEEYRSSF